MVKSESTAPIPSRRISLGTIELMVAKSRLGGSTVAKSVRGTLGGQRSAGVIPTVEKDVVLIGGMTCHLCHMAKVMSEKL